MLNKLHTAPEYTQGFQTPINIERYDSGVVLVRMVDADSNNRLSRHLLQRLSEVLTSVRQDEHCKAVVLVGNGGHFLNQADGESLDELAADVQRQIVEADTPFVAAVTGDASGWGWLLAMCCDAAVYSDEGIYTYCDMARGHVPGGGATLLFPLRMGDSVGREILFGGGSYTGQQLRQRAKCSSLPRHAVEKEAIAMAAHWADLPRELVLPLKQELAREIREGLSNTLALEDQMQRRVLQSANEQSDRRSTAAPEETGQIGFVSDVVSLEVLDNGVACVTMCDRSSKNTFSDALGQGLLGVFAHINQRKDCKVVVLTGYDNYFACGGTKEGLLSIQSGAMKFSDVRVYSLGLECDIPVIAAMQGHGIGAGWAMGMFCDFVVFSSESTYVSNYMRYGFTPGAGATLIFPQRLGDSLAGEILFTASEYKGHELEARGIDMPVLSRAGVLDHSLGMADRIARASRESLVALKSLMCQPLRDRLEDVFAREVAMHEKTFVGNPDVALRIQSEFNGGHDKNNPSPEHGLADNCAHNKGDGLETLRAELRGSLAQELYMAADEVDPDQQFIDMGLDSVTGVSWIRKINERYGLSISATKVYDFPNLSLFSEYVFELGRDSGVFADGRDYEKSQVDEPLPCAQQHNTINNNNEHEHEHEHELDAVRAKLKMLLADELYMDAGALDDDMTFVDLGLDSVTGVTWVRKINACYGLSIPATRVYDYTTLHEFARHVVETGHNEGVEFAPGEKPAPIRRREPVAEAVVPQSAPGVERQARNRGEPKANTPKASKASPSAFKTPHNARRDNQSKLGDEQQLRYDDAVAIVGMSGQFPQARNVDEFWDNIAKGRNCISDVPPERWDMDRYFDPDPQAPGKTYCRQMGVLQDVDKFDPLFFNISPAEAKFIEPQQRLFLENCWACIENSGINPYALSDSRCGVFVGCAASDYGERMSAHNLMGAAASILSARIAYLLNLKGPCLAIDTSCSSSLVAIAEACNSLALGTSDLALAGGVCVLSSPAIHVMTAKAGMLSKDSRCYTFDARANGFVPGEGVGVLMLKRLSDAIRDEDPIAGVIRGWGINQDGKTNGITAPSANSQTRLEQEVYKRFNIHPETVSLVEAHGTGTKLGDPIEVEALTASFRQQTRKAQYCALGSVKSNIGHLMTAAGVAGTIKVVKAMQHKALPPTINFEQLNEHIALDNGPFFINTALRPWKTDGDVPRRAAVSSFGFSGTNAHLVLEEYCPELAPADNRLPAGRDHLFVLSARSEAQLKLSATRLRAYIADHENINLADVAYTLQVGRAEMSHRLAVLADGRETLLRKLQRYIEGEAGAPVMVAQVKSDDAIDVLSADEDAQALLRVWITKNKLEKLGQLWVTGMAIDWTALYDGERPRRCNLPTYPFADERYWTDSGDDDRADGVAKLHPLVHRNISTFEAQQFATTFSGHESFLVESEVHNGKVLPAMACLQMALAAGRLATEQDVVVIENAVWGAPVVVDGRTDINIRLFERDNGIAFEILSPERDDGTAAVVHHQGMLTTDASATNDVQHLDFEAIESRGLAGAERDKTAMPRHWPGLPRSAKIAVRCQGDDEVLVNVEFGEHGVSGGKSTMPHSGVLDALLERMARLITPGAEDRQDTPRWVSSVDSVALSRIDTSEDGMVVYMRITEATAAEAKYDIQLADRLGNVCLSLSGYTISRVERENVITEDNATDGSGGDPYRFALDKLNGLVSKITRIPVASIDTASDFEHLGLDSIMIASLNHKLKHWVGTLEPTLFFKYKTLSSLARYLVAEYPEAMEGEVRPSATSVSTPRLSPLRSSHRPQQAQSGRRHDTARADPEIAIIGMSGQYPQARNLSEFWTNLSEARDCVTEIPADRFDYKPLFSEERGREDRIYCKWGGFIDDVDKFDALFFNVSPQDARLMDPQERLFMEAVWQCLESAGHITPNWQKTSRNIGVFAGATFNNYQLLSADAAEQRLLAPVNSQTFSIANHASYYFNFSGPSITVDTACSASLYAIHLACESIKRGESEMAIAGGVNLSLHPSKYFTICARGFAASDGRCHAFADGGDGYVPSEGVGAVLLKPLTLAMEDGDNILAVIKGTGVSHDGKTQNYTTPNPVAQTKAIASAVNQAGISPASLSYIEAHGTGTVLGDPIEIDGLMDVFSKYTDKKQFCAIGSVKTNIGHGEAAAGIAQLTKTVLQLQHKTLVPTLLHGAVNPNIDFQNSPFYVQRDVAPWVRPERDGKSIPRRAGISSFGAGGVNVHVVVEEAPECQKARSEESGDNTLPMVVPLSAHVQSQLDVLASHLLAYLEDNDDCLLADVAYTLQTRRANHRFRLAFVVNDKAELVDKLRAYLNRVDAEGPRQGCYEGDVRKQQALPGDAPFDVIEMMAHGRVGEVAEYWVSGEDIPWHGLYRETVGRRCLTLPTYPFLRRRYWVTQGVKPVAQPELSPAPGNAGQTPADVTAERPVVSTTAPVDDVDANPLPPPETDQGRVVATLTPLLEEIVDLSDLDREERLNAFLERQIKDILGFDEGDSIDHDLGFFELGMESMQAVSLNQRIQDQLTVTLSDTALFDFPSIERLTGHLLEVIPWDGLVMREQTQGVEHAGAPDVLPDVAVTPVAGGVMEDCSQFLSSDSADIYDDLPDDVVIEELLRELA